MKSVRMKSTVIQKVSMVAIIGAFLPSSIQILFSFRQRNFDLNVIIGKSSCDTFEYKV